MFKVEITVEEKKILDEIISISPSGFEGIAFENEKKIYLLIQNSEERLKLFDRITTLLQAEGFDIDYNPNYKGVLLERLIDKLNF